MITDEHPTTGEVRSAGWPRIDTRYARHYGPAALLAALLACLYAPVFAEAAPIWLTDEYSTHCLFIPFMAGLLIWWRRREAAGAPVRPSAWGFALLAPGLCLEMVAWYAQIRSFAVLSLVPILAGVTLLTAGPSRLRILWFPIVFLAFMAPLPRYLVLPISFPIQVVSAQTACWAAREVGVPLVQAGFDVELPGVTVQIEESCSGFKKAVALLVFGCFYASLFAVPVWRQCVLVALACPVAVCANIVRVFLLILAGAWGGVAGVHLLHDVSGLLVLGLCFAMLVGLGRWLGCRRMRYTA